MKARIFDHTGKHKGDLTLKESVFGVTPSGEAVLHYIRVYRANQRQGNSSTKNRGEVKGSSAKPWTQKHTGRARAGEKRNPIWRHGGVAHGPKPKDWRLDLSSSLRTRALLSVLSSKASESGVSVVEDFNFEKVSAKTAATFLKNAKLSGKTLIVLPSKTDPVYKSFRNLNRVSTIIVDDANVYDYVTTKNILFVKSALESLEKKLKENK